MTSEGLPTVVIVCDPETEENAGFRYGVFGKGRATNKEGGVLEFYCVQRPPAGEHPNVGFGTWRVKWMNHPEHGFAYHLLDVAGRMGILIHAANWFQELLGCLAFGASIDHVLDVQGKWLGRPMFKQLGVTSSVDTVHRFNEHMGREDFLLTIL